MATKTVKIGDEVTLPSKAGNYVRLPDGTVVTARRTYTVRHEGTHHCGSLTFTGKK